jgi:transposase
VYDEYEVVVGARTMWNILSRGGWSRRIGRHIARERNQQLRALWKTKIAFWPVEKVVCVDESGVNEKTGWRKYGWSPERMPCDNVGSCKRSERCSILPAMSVNGYFNNVLVKQGAITGEDFLHWIWTYVLPQMELRMILVMDNASIHHDERLLELAAAHHVSVEYLPSYPPDFNPIERSFCEHKAFIKRHQGVIEAYNNFEEFILWALSDFKAPHAREQYRKCGFDVDSL